jgi:hypothetical protein
MEPFSGNGFVERYVYDLEELVYRVDGVDEP